VCTFTVLRFIPEKVAKEAAEKAGDIDLLVNSAGIAILEPFLETKVENFQVIPSIVRYS
jgi:short-subunit dehydrogenase